MKPDLPSVSPAALARLPDTAGASVLVSDLGGTRLRVAVVEASGSVSSKKVLATPKNDPAVLAATMRRVRETADRRVVGAVVGVPGPVDYSSGDVIKLPNLPGWEETVSASSLADELGLPVLVANDADLAALGEHRYGAGRGSDDMLYVTSSTGVGAGVIIGGRLLHGRLSLAEAGHTIIDLSTEGTLEGMGSGTALARAAGEDAASVAARAANGDPDAVQLFERAADAFAVGVFNLVHCFSPEEGCPRLESCCWVPCGEDWRPAGAPVRLPRPELSPPMGAMMSACAGGSPTGWIVDRIPRTLAVR